MNKSRYVTRQIDMIDRAIIVALSENGRITIRELAAQIGMSSPSVTDRILKLQDAGAIQAYTISIDPKVFGLGVAAHVRLRALPGQIPKLTQMLAETPQIVEADRVTGEDCFVAKVLASDAEELQTVVDRFIPFSSTDTAIVQSSPVAPRLPKL
jgi:Lrp/AsnC family transcriptional regulator, leucine-responsive regulatory protein